MMRTHRARLALAALLLGSSACSRGGAGDDGAAGPLPPPAPGPAAPSPRGPALARTFHYQIDDPLTQILRSRLDAAGRRLFLLTRTLATREAGPARPSGIEVRRIEIDTGRTARLFFQSGTGETAIPEPVWISTYLSTDGREAYLTTGARANEQMTLYRIITNGTDEAAGRAESLGVFSKNIYYRQSDDGGTALYLRYDEATILDRRGARRSLESSVGRGDVSRDGRHGLIRTQSGSGSSLLIDASGAALGRVDYRDLSGDGIWVSQSLLTGTGDVFSVVGEAAFRHSYVFLFETRAPGVPLVRLESPSAARRYLDIAVAPRPGWGRRAVLSYANADPRRLDVELWDGDRRTVLALDNVSYESENLKGFDEGLTHFLEFADECTVVLQLDRQVEVLDTCAAFTAAPG